MNFLRDNLTQVFFLYFDTPTLFVISKLISVSNDYFLVLLKDVFTFNNNVIICIYRSCIFNQIMTFLKNEYVFWCFRIAPSLTLEKWISICETFSIQYTSWRNCWPQTTHFKLNLDDKLISFSIIEFCCTDYDMMYLTRGWKYSFHSVITVMMILYSITLIKPDKIIEICNIFRIQVQELSGPLVFLSFHGTRAGIDSSFDENVRRKWRVEEKFYNEG